MRIALSQPLNAEKNREHAREGETKLQPLKPGLSSGNINSSDKSIDATTSGIRKI